MLAFSEHLKRIRPTTTRTRFVPDETLVADERNGASPSTIVNRKLRAALAMRQTPADAARRN
jgi:hypothetical protein